MYLDLYFACLSYPCVSNKQLNRSGPNFVGDLWFPIGILLCGIARNCFRIVWNSAELPGIARNSEEIECTCVGNPSGTSYDSKEGLWMLRITKIVSASFWFLENFKNARTIYLISANSFCFRFILYKVKMITNKATIKSQKPSTNKNYWRLMFFFVA